jgi:hypothetical protein
LLSVVVCCLLLTVASVSRQILGEVSFTPFIRHGYTYLLFGAGGSRAGGERFKRFLFSFHFSHSFSSFCFPD